MVPQLFFPLAERDQFVMDVWLPEGAKIEATDAAVRRIEAVLSKEKLVKVYASFLGESAPRFYYNVNPQAPAANYAQILVNTSSAKETPKLVERLRERLPDVAPEAKVFVKELQQGQIMEAPVEVRIVGRRHCHAGNAGQPGRGCLAAYAGRDLYPHRLARGRLAGGRECARGSGQPDGLDQCRASRSNWRRALKARR